MIAVKQISRCLFGVFFIVAGANHFVHPELYELMMPPYLRAHAALIAISGAAEVLLGALLIPLRTSRAAGWGLIALLIAIFPANLHMALHTESYPFFSPVILWLRLPLQIVFIAWAYWYTRSADGFGSRRDY